MNLLYSEFQRLLSLLCSALGTFKLLRKFTMFYVASGETVKYIHNMLLVALKI